MNYDAIHNAFIDAQTPGNPDAAAAVALLSATFLDTTLSRLHQVALDGEAADEAATQTITIGADHPMYGFWEDDKDHCDVCDPKLMQRRIEAEATYGLYLAGMRSVWDRITIGFAERNVIA